MITHATTGRAALRDRVRTVVRDGAAALLDHQHHDGWWEGRVESDASVTAQHLLMARYVDRLDPGVEGPMLEHLRRAQLRGGGWPVYPGGPPSLDASLSCYAALKFGGVPKDSADLMRARRVILNLGGLEQAGFSPRAPLVAWGQLPTTSLTYASPKLMLIPPAVHPHLRDFGVLLPAALSMWLICKRRAVRTPTPARDLAELRNGRAYAGLSRSATDVVISTASRWADALVPAPGLDRAAAEWLVEQQNADGLWSGPSHITNRCLMALAALDPTRHRSAIGAGLAGLARLQVSAGAERWQAPGRSPVLDTAIAVVALVESGVPPSHPRLRRAYEWLIAVQARRGGEWQRSARPVAPGGWSYLPENDRNPDTDTTLHVLDALGTAPSDMSGRDAALARGLRWLLGMQNRNGSWAMLAREPRVRLQLPRELARYWVADDGTPDVTARAVRVIARLAGASGPATPDTSPAIARACRFLAATQGADGAWPGRWDVNYVYGAAQGLTALVFAGAGGSTAAGRAAAFVRGTQQADGGWGESPESFGARRFLPAPSTTTQTCFALLALLSAAGGNEPAVASGVELLLDRRDRAGTWNDETFCQVILPGHIYFRNSLLATSLGQTVLARYVCRGGERPGAAA